MTRSWTLSKGCLTSKRRYGNRLSASDKGECVYIAKSVCTGTVRCMTDVAHYQERYSQLVLHLQATELGLVEVREHQLAKLS